LAKLERKANYDEGVDEEEAAIFEDIFRDPEGNEGGEDEGDEDGDEDMKE